jgi:hypothetical protein
MSQFAEKQERPLNLRGAVHESERNWLLKLQRVLLLVASDIDQAEAAARALATQSEGVLARALETVMAVCYMRAFTTSSLMKLPPAYLPSTPSDLELHNGLEELRNKVYAHTDKASGRTASIEITGVSGEVTSAAWREEWMPFPREMIDACLGLFERQRRKFQIGAAAIQLELDA